MRVDFFKLELPEGGPSSLDEIFNLIDALPNDESRTREIQGSTVRIQSLERSPDNCWEGDAIRIRMNKLPLIVSQKGDTDVLDLDADEGIGEETAFMYMPDLNVLAIQRNRMAVSTNLLLRTIEKFTSFEGAVIPLPILQSDAIDQLLRVRTVRKFGVRFAGVQNPGLVVNPDDTTKGAISLLQDAKAPTVEVTIGMGYERGSLPVRAVRQAATTLHRWAVGSDNPQTDVDKITVEGRFEDGSSADFDLLEYRITESVEVVEDVNRRLPYESRRVGIHDAWIRREDEIKSIVKAE